MSAQNRKTPACGAFRRPAAVFYPISQNHQQCPRADEQTADQGLGREALVQEHERQHERDDHAELVDRHDLRRLPDLQHAVIAQPHAPVARPERIRNSQLFLLMSVRPPCVLVTNTIPHAIASTTIVRMADAGLEFTPSMPTLARMDVSAANTAESRANTNHIPFPPFPARLTHTAPPPAGSRNRPHRGACAHGRSFRSARPDSPAAPAGRASPHSAHAPTAASCPDTYTCR